MSAKSTETQDQSSKKIQGVISSSISGASQLVSLQLFSRLITFILNQIIVKRVGSKTYGAATVDFELLLSTILFLSREGFRCALLRAEVESQVSSNESSSKKNEQLETKKQLQINLTYLPIPIGVIIASFFIGFRICFSNTEVDSVYYYRSAMLYILAAILELFSEPFYILALTQLKYELRVKIEGIAVIVRCFATYAISYYLFENFGIDADKYALLSFGFSQLLYSLVLLFGYINHFGKTAGIKNLLPTAVSTISDGIRRTQYFDTDLLKLSVTLSVQSFVKHLLTEGDKLLLAFLDHDGEGKGRYSLASHYGSLVARILFQPLEEASRGLFSKLLKDVPTQKEVAFSKNSSVLSAAKILSTTLKFHLLFGMIFVFFVPHYTSTLFDLILGPSWSQTNAPIILAVYCLYIPIMGINGITEAFVQAVAQPDELQRLSHAMFFFTGLFLIFGFCLLKVLPVVAYAVILANCFNLTLRIVWSLTFIGTYFNRDCQHGPPNPTFSFYNVLPSFYVMVGFSCSSIICHFSKTTIGIETLSQKFLHITVGATCFVFTSGLIWIFEKEFRSQLADLLRRDRGPIKQD